jgi:hypothetical protein
VKHLERHPEPVQGCFGCKVIGMQFLIPHHMSARSDTNADRETAAGIKAKVASDPERYHQSGTRWI